MDLYIDINSVAALQGYRIDSSTGNLILGANMSLSQAIIVFNKLAKENSNKFAYLKGLADHIDLVANVPVRNVSST